MSIKVVVAGATGKMGSEAIKMILREPDFKLIGAIASPRSTGDIGEFIGIGPIDINISHTLEQVLANHQVDVLVDLTTPEHVKENMLVALKHDVRPVVGTTGLSADDIAEIAQLSKERGVGAIIAPNFAIGAILMMKFAEQAAKYMPHVEIIEKHHDQKLDAPSGTARKTAELIAQAREEMKQGHPDEKEELDGARGAFYNGFRIHSVRLPGLVAHQQVIFGGEGQTLTIQHDSIHRSSFMPGISLAIKHVQKLDRLIYGLEHIID